MSALPFLGKLRVRVYYTVLNKISSHMTGTIIRISMVDAVKVLSWPVNDKATSIKRPSDEFRYSKNLLHMLAEGAQIM